MKHTCFSACLILLLSWLGSGTLNAQEDVETIRPERLSGVGAGMVASTRGGGFQIHYLNGLPHKKWMVSLDFSSLKDHREELIESAFRDKGSSFIFGKVNHAFVLAPVAGIQQELFPNHHNRIKLKVSGQLGPALALLTPYKVEVFEPAPGSPLYGFRTVEAYNPEEHSYEDIIGRTNFFSSDLSLSTQVGLAIRTQIWMDLTQSQKMVGGIVLGMNADIFPENLPIMSHVENPRSYFSFHVGLIFAGMTAKKRREKSDER